MLAKLTSKNQLTLPKSAINAIGKVEYFDVTVQHKHLVLMPVRFNQADKVRAKLATLGICEKDIQDAVTWAKK